MCSRQTINIQNKGRVLAHREEREAENLIRQFSNKEMRMTNRKILEESGKKYKDGDFNVSGAFTPLVQSTNQ